MRPLDPGDESRDRLVEYAYALGICPNCGRSIASRVDGSGKVRPDGYGSGSLPDGLFCSLDCFASFWY